MTSLTQDEQRTLMTLWAIARSPLMYGGHLPSNDAFSLSLMTNAEVLEANQNGTNSHQLFHDNDHIGWVSDAPHSRAKYLSVFNVGDNSRPAIRVDFASLGIADTCEISDLWQSLSLGKARSYTFHVPPHASGLYKLTPSH